MQTVAFLEFKITSDAGHMERDFFIKQNSGCKQQGRRLEILNERYKCVAQIQQRTRQAMYVQRDIKARSCNHCCSGKALNNTYCVCVCVCVFVVLGTQHATRMRHTAIRGLSSSAVFSHTNKRHDFRGGRGGYQTQNVCLDFLYNFCLKHSHSQTN